MIEWMIFGIVVTIMLLLDLGVFNKKSHEISNKEALTWSIVWVSLAMAFGLFVYFDSGIERASQFFSAYGIEKLLSVDNLFVFIMVFGYFKVPKLVQHKVLFWGIIGALVFRAIFIFTGVKLIELTYLPEFDILGHNLRVNVLLTLFGGFLVYAGIKSVLTDDDVDDEKDFSKSPGAKFIKLLFPRVTEKFHNDKFFVKVHSPHDIEKSNHPMIINSVYGGIETRTLPTKMITYATPLLVVVGVIEFTDLLFAVDSIPAIFAIAPNDPFILYSSNIFAILGLRSLYFLLSNSIDKFKYLKYGIALILSFIGIKMLIAPVFHIEAFDSLMVLTGILTLTVSGSLVKNKK